MRYAHLDMLLGGKLAAPEFSYSRYAYNLLPLPLPPTRLSSPL